MPACASPCSTRLGISSGRRKMTSTSSTPTMRATYSRPLPMRRTSKPPPLRKLMHCSCSRPLLGNASTNFCLGCSRSSCPARTAGFALEIVRQRRNRHELVASTADLPDARLAFFGSASADVNHAGNLALGRVAQGVAFIAALHVEFDRAAGLPQRDARRDAFFLAIAALGDDQGLWS